MADPLETNAPIAHALRAEAVLLLEHGQLRLAPLDGATLTPSERAEDGAAEMAEAPQAALVSGPAPNWLTPVSLRALGALTAYAEKFDAMTKAITEALNKLSAVPAKDGGNKLCPTWCFLT